MTRVSLVAISCLLAFGGHAAGQTISLAGEPELVISHNDMNCGRTPNGSGSDVTDVPVSAFRRKDGSVVVVSGNQNNYFLEGTLDAPKRTSCKNLIPPVVDRRPEQFVARRWLFAIHAVDYNFVLGFVHNEYHGTDFFPDCVKTSQRDFECWYGSATLVVSHDGGFTFETPPKNVLAAPAQKFQVGRKRLGMNAPKVVTNPADGLSYVMVTEVDRNREITARECLLRGSGKSLDDWRAWDGKGFTLDMRSPYDVARGPDCVAVIPYGIQSLKYVPAIKKFVAIGPRGRRLAYTFSDDLIHWEKPKTLMAITRKQARAPNDPPAMDYFSLLDPTSPSINFDTLEGRPYLYFVQYNPQNRRARDVYRIPVKIN